MEQEGGMNPIDVYYHMIYEDIRLTKAVYDVTDDKIVVKLSSANEQGRC